MAEDIVFKLSADFFKTLGHPVRIKILHLLKNGELCVCEMIEKLDIEQSNLSQHLRLLKKQGIIDSRKDGQRVIYWIIYPQVLELLDKVEMILGKQINDSHNLLKFLR